MTGGFEKVGGLASRSAAGRSPVSGFDRSCNEAHPVSVNAHIAIDRAVNDFRNFTGYLPHDCLALDVCLDGLRVLALRLADGGVQSSRRFLLALKVRRLATLRADVLPVEKRADKGNEKADA